MKKILVAVFLLAVILVLIYLRPWQLKPTTPVARPNIVINQNTISVEIADDPSEQATGLSGHAPLLDNQGMLFVFPNKQERKFWMKNMLFPIDIIWIADNQIVKIDPDLSPEGEDPEFIYDSQAPVNYVLEINAGIARKRNFKAGDRVTINL